MIGPVRRQSALDGLLGMGSVPAASPIRQPSPNRWENPGSRFKIRRMPRILVKKQSHRVIEKTKERPEIEQNNPNFGQFRG